MKRRAAGLVENIHLVSGSAHPQLAETTAHEMDVPLREITAKEFANTERYVRYENSVRGTHVVAIQSLIAVNGCSVNDFLMELLLMIDAAKRASASTITAVMPQMAYGRQDRKARGREPISAALVVKMLRDAGADRLVSIDMHSSQTQGNFNGPFDHLTAEPLLQKALKNLMKEDEDDTFVIVSPDGGGAKTAGDYADDLDIDVVYMSKKRNRLDSSKIKRPDVISGVDGRVCVLIDDMIDTAGTLVSAAEALRRSGAKKIIAAATHGLFSGPAIKRLQKSPIDRLVVTDTVPLDAAKATLGDKLQIIPIAPLLARALDAIATHGSVSEIFNDRNHQ